MHSLLRRQLKRFFGSEASLRPEIAAFVAAVDEAYRAFDEDRVMLERSLDLSSTELLQANSEMRAIFQAFPDLLFWLDWNGRILDFKGGGDGLYMDPRQFLGKRVQDVPLPEVARRFDEAIRTVKLTGFLVRVEYTMTVRGRESVFEARLLPLHGERIVALVRDITVRARAEKELAAQKTFLRQTIDLAPNFIFAKDRQGRFTLVNQAVAEAYGTSVEMLIGRKDEDFNSNVEEVEHFRRDDLEVMNTGKDKVILEERITDSQGRLRLLQTIKRAIVSPGGTADQVLGVATDITERKKLEEQLLQSQKMEAVGLLAGGVAHDFNNLLNVITGYSELAARSVERGHPAHDSLERVMSASFRAADLTRKLLAFSRRQVLQVKPFELGEVLHEFTRMLGRIVGEDIEVEVTSADVPMVVKADPGQLEQVLLNLCTNARQAMPRGGRLTIALHRVSLSAADLAGTTWATAGDYAVVDVSDTGCGMDEKTLEKIFEPFFTTKEAGTGLGLATVYGIIRQHNGIVRVRSEPGRGSTFQVYLPLDRSEHLEKRGALGDGADTAHAGHETILICEDEPMLRDLMTARLSGLGYRILTSEDGEAAIEVFRQHPGEVELVVLDAVMPRMSGPDAFRAMRAYEPSLRAVLVSGYAPESVHLEDLLREEGVAFLPKPFLMSDLAKAIRELIEKPSPARANG